MTHTALSFILRHSLIVEISRDRLHTYDRLCYVASIMGDPGETEGACIGK
jgi:hypothetical protein